MAAIELQSLSSNWKKLQKTLKLTQSEPPSSKKEIKEDNLLKRKRSGNFKEDHTKELNGTTISSSKAPPPRKRPKMEEPSSIGASPKAPTLSRSTSMPTLLPPPSSPLKSSSAPTSILSPSPSYPDTENQGPSPTALPGKYIALDCEMVGTGPEPDRDSALARVSLVNFHGHQIYDSYVQVRVPVTDYRTHVSGIHPRHLSKSFARPFKEVQADVKVLLENRILVGHALRNDLDVLLLKHDKRCTRDTSKYSAFRALSMTPGRTPGLKHLVERVLGVEIQVGAHSSVEDARAAMALFRGEKEGFDAEVLRLYGSVKVGEGEGEGGEVVQTRKKKTRKKKKKKGGKA